MKSDLNTLESRGFVPEDDSIHPINLTLEEKLELLNHAIPKKRTLGARLLRTGDISISIIQQLIVALEKEKKLYTKIEISKSLESAGKKAISQLIPMLGKIGTNQHKAVPIKQFKKDNYPLPRDIISRLIGQIGIEALPELLNSFFAFETPQKLEAIDAIGFISFYHKNKLAFPVLEKCYQLNIHSELFQWKIFRACSGLVESIDFLETEKNKTTNSRLTLEIERSIRLIKKNN